MTLRSDRLATKLLVGYYAATAIFMLFDFGFDINIRLTFLDAQPGWRIAYYVFCFACLALMLWRPSWQSYVAITESMITLSLIIIGTALRVIVVNDEMIETGRGFVSTREIVNFVISFLIVYVSYARNASAIAERF